MADDVGKLAAKIGLDATNATLGPLDGSMNGLRQKMDIHPDQAD